MNQDIYVVIEQLQGQVADISYVMLAAARVWAQSTGGGVTAVLLGHDVQGLGERFAADQVIYMDHPALQEFTPDAYQKVLTSLISSETPRTIIFGNTSIGTDLAGVLSARLGLPLLSSCQFFTPNGTVTSRICGGKILVECELPESTTLITFNPGSYKAEEGMSDTPPKVRTVAAPMLEDMRITWKQYIEPETGDVDITKEPTLIAVGRGIQTQDNLELAEELAEALGGVVCASRPVVDQGWLSTSRLVGKSGKKVKPTIYITMGISGAPEHVEGMTDSQWIFAINTDPAAPIFNAAKFGTTMDLFDLVPVLTEKVRAAKSG